MIGTFLSKFVYVLSSTIERGDANDKNKLRFIFRSVGT